LTLHKDDHVTQPRQHIASHGKLLGG
jgi:hypothetical protein